MPVEEISPATLIALIVELQIVEATYVLTADADLFAQGMDSLAIMQLLLHVEQRYGIRIPPGEMTRERFATPAVLAAWLSDTASRLSA